MARSGGLPGGDPGGGPQPPLGGAPGGGPQPPGGEPGALLEEHQEALPEEDPNRQGGPPPGGKPPPAALTKPLSITQTPHFNWAKR